MCIDLVWARFSLRCPRFSALALSDNNNDKKRSILFDLDNILDELALQIYERNLAIFFPPRMLSEVIAENLSSSWERLNKITGTPAEVHRLARFEDISTEARIMPST